ncbi:MAG: hypothetical protein WD672_06165 [Woeseia sp.]
MKPFWLAIVFGSSLAGCASQSANMQIGNDVSYASIEEQRKATQEVRVTETVPSGARTVGSVDASRCHRNSLDKSPDDGVIILDLQVSAYARGADGIAQVSIDKSRGAALLKNCWSVVTGTAIAYRLE